MLALLVAGAVVLALLVVTALAYNRLIRLRNQIADGWAGIDVQLTRRADLVPNLVKVVEAYAAHEQTTFRETTEARARVQAATGPAAAGPADEQLQGSLKSLLAVAEAYPDLKANENFLELQQELSRIEEDVAFARSYYNAVVRKFNDAQQTFPILVLARALQFRPAEFFQADLDDRDPPHV